ncbi:MULTISPECIES: cysteine--1-D-myo-inosityl 2-amino-2-deoxy-alpha-D-glucopyranoside ligase [unclassified Rathayibacter]|uniref:cysteine--1-D-myo-inosityl 2-amino-2-deoxy-alpha-D-glucopyranoside ligase n=1 Tax=unclassified Rathayibacter TaxID=2609250 RepID=UPI000CE79942|nr:MULTISPECIES: cysteine--1-D-myo-inosityl 2-amino-2-deoxy-alpha-D-glucopyranoside ligase [unclassified Rathayibacter]PPG83929.1 cysteine--1-D-myo-inosityl 2-amino-2-deoxy-alpha-D-glucopyranoside ligase [Rathayibacter sp. AY1E5]PPH32717.1 cysteine--1-D-myo-inosityl 2-amino-2-deoxy-alpha-D-glucopyranoside ligase [Rathayibacter sp. AY1C3]PPH61482.1 cysteine--1-D-myo-inosityl 2-amino-2-deoxy-alpha-D-glucopyranoside ligase [Rathayibacter sp. AY1D7]PPI33668.1 cysteine--1-D-myo-inosityl 2-amino-2-de
MRAWTAADVPALPGRGSAPLLHDTATAGPVELDAPSGVASLYVCGITPYDATHLGHASTYLAFDTVQRVWLDAGYTVEYAQNVTDVDDPLLERATATCVDWRDLAEEQVELFRGDMAALRVLPPQHYVGVTETVDPIAEAVARLERDGVAYRVAAPDAAEEGASDLYYDIAAAESAVWHLGSESRLDAESMARLSALRGGDPERAGKRDPLDPLLWRAERADEPAWDAEVGRGRPGWHIECSVIALDRLGPEFTLQGGGSDLVFPHHEFSAGHAASLSGRPLARAYAHAGMVAYQGEKMSKSLGNLVLVSRLRSEGADPRAIRLALLAHHYRSDWEWLPEDLPSAEARLVRWEAALAAVGPRSALEVLAQLREALADDLGTPAALAVVDAALTEGVDDPSLLRDAVDALLGVRPA